MKARSNKIVFIVMSLSQPRCIKRVSALAKSGYNCVVYGYNRGLYDVNKYPDSIELHELGTMHNGEVYANLKTIRKDVKQIIRDNGTDCLYYCFGLLSLIFVFARKDIKYVYEISDIPYAYPKYDRIRFLIKALDKIIIRQSSLTVMTSGGFNNYFKVKNGRIIIQPNKVSPILKNLDRSPRELTVCRYKFAFIGSIRYNTVLRFAQIIGEVFPQHEFHFYGGAAKDRLSQVLALAEKYDNIKYHGLFKSPDDLISIYNAIDIVVACYDNSSQNERIAEPNKLYESICFCKPIVVSGETYLADRVKELGCGFVLENQSRDSIVRFIRQIEVSSVNDISNRDLSLSEDDFIDDMSILTKRISDVFGKMDG
jgi:glycosyltransferase involved in cell wall biosynthesis